VPPFFYFFFFPWGEKPHYSLDEGEERPPDFAEWAHRALLSARSSVPRNR